MSKPEKDPMNETKVMATMQPKLEEMLGQVKQLISEALNQYDQ